MVDAKPTVGSAVVVPMRFYANWDVDRNKASATSAIPRTLSMVFTRLVLTRSLSTDNTPLIIAVRLQGHRRTLRSNDLNISPLRLDHVLDISFTIQYCHFVKRKANILQLLVQRRKRYKNRQIPGFKTLAVGYLNLDEILQFGGPRQVSVWDTAYLNKSRSSVKELHAGTVHIANCLSQAFESFLGGDQDGSSIFGGGTKLSIGSRVPTNSREAAVLSEEEAEEDSSGADDSDFDDFEPGGTPRGGGVMPDVVGTSGTRRKAMGQQVAVVQQHRSRTKQLLKQKNIKQKVVALLRRFRPEEEVAAVSGYSGASTTSRVVPPTEQELQEIFDELDNISDYSGPELEPDAVSIISNPRPGIRPFFGSKTNILPSIISDHQQEELAAALQFSDDMISGDSLADDQEPSSADAEDATGNRFWQQHFPPETTPTGRTTIKAESKTGPFPVPPLNGESPKRSLLRHSSTINSLPPTPPATIPIAAASNYETKAPNSTPRTNPAAPALRKAIDPLTQLMTLLDGGDYSQMAPRLPQSACTPLPSASASLQTAQSTTAVPLAVVPAHIWFCSSADLPWLTNVGIEQLGAVRLLDCTSSADVRSVLQAIISRIQKFCNTNSISPPTTTIGVFGGDRLLAHVLGAYVDLLQHKACQDEWLNYLRFSPIVPPSSAAGRLLAQVADGGYSEAVWKALNRVAGRFDAGQAGPAEHQEMRECLLGVTGGTPQRATNLQIGEVMLQLISIATTAVDSGSGPDEQQQQQSSVDKSQVFVPFLAELLTSGCPTGSGDDLAVASTSSTCSPLHYMRPNTGGAHVAATTVDDHFDNADATLAPTFVGQSPATNPLQAMAATAVAPVVPQPSSTTTVQHYSSPLPVCTSQSFPTFADAYLTATQREQDVATAEGMGNSKPMGNLSPRQHQTGAQKNSSTTITPPSSVPSASGIAIPNSSNVEHNGRELHIEYWTAAADSAPSMLTSTSQLATTISSTSSPAITSTSSGSAGAMTSGGKFSMKASVRTLSIAREPMSNLLSLLFVKESKKDKVLQKLGRKSKQRSIEGGGGAGFSAQSRVVSGVTRVVCTCGSVSGGVGSGKSKDRRSCSAMEISIDGVLWRKVRFFQISAQWQTHVKLFPVSFPLLPTVNVGLAVTGAATGQPK